MPESWYEQEHETRSVYFRGWLCGFLTAVATAVMVTIASLLLFGCEPGFTDQDLFGDGTEEVESLQLTTEREENP